MDHGGEANDGPRARGLGNDRGCLSGGGLETSKSALLAIEHGPRAGAGCVAPGKTSPTGIGLIDRAGDGRNRGVESSSAAIGRKKNAA